MKNKILLLFSLALYAPTIVLTTSCRSSYQVFAYKTLASIGEAVDLTMKQAAQARVAGEISDAQWQEIKRIHDLEYIPAYRLAVDAAATASSPAPQRVIELSTRLAALLAKYLPSP